MNVLITGGAGYIGSHTVNEFLKQGYKVFVLDNLKTGFEVAIPLEAEFTLGYITETALIYDVLVSNEIDVVIHFAAEIVVSDSVKYPLEYYKANTEGLISLLRAMKSAKKNKLIFSSTAAVYGNPAQVPIKESSAKTPINPYGRSKWMSEQIIQDYAAVSDLKFMILRYFNVAGAADDLSNGQRSKLATHLIKIVSQYVLGKRPILEVFGTDYETFDGSCIRDYIHVQDLAEVHYLATEHLMTHNQSQILNCGYGEGYSVLEVIRAFEKILDQDIWYSTNPRRLGDPAILIADNSLMTSTLEWKPKRNNLELICRSALEWEKKLL